MAPQVRILRLPRSDAQDEHILVRVEQASITRPLDLKLIATEHEHLYHGETKASKISSLKNDRWDGSDDDFRDLLSACLLQEQPDGASAELLRGIEFVAALDKTHFVLTIQRRVAKVITKLAFIRLEQDDEREEVSPFEWLDTAVALSDELRVQVKKLDAALAKQRDETAALRKQLEEFVNRKKENDDEMLQKFVLLLNSKKRKIRDQQNRMRDAGIDPTVDLPVREKDDIKGKRKAEEEDEPEEDVEMPDEDELDADEGRATPSESEGEQEAGDDLGDALMDEAPRPSTRGSAASSKASQPATNGTKHSVKSSSTMAAELDEEEETDDEL